MSTVGSPSRSPHGAERRRRIAGLGLALSLLVPAAGAETGTSIHLSFDGAPGCSDRAALEREIERRAERLQWHDDGGAAVIVSVRIANGVGRVDSVLSIERTGRAPVIRAVTGRTCDEVIEATALIVAVLISPSAEAPANSAAPPQSSAAPPPPPPPSAAPRARMRWGGGTGFVLVTDIAPGTLPGVEGFLDASMRRNGVSPAFRLAFREVWRSDFAFGSARAAFRLTAGAASLCPFALTLGDAFALRPCPAATLGVLEATGSATPGARAEQHPWASAGGGLRLEAQLLPVLSLEAEAGSEVALFESRFYLDGYLVHLTPAVMSRAGISVAVRLP